MNKHLLLGVPYIDHQHDELLRSLQHLLAAGKCDEGFSEVISRLTIQIHDHFQSEERFMAGLALPPEMMREHEREHSRIIEELTQMHLDTMAGLRLSFEDIIGHFVSYISQHVIEFDLRLKPYIAQPA